ncbi:MAG: IPTL-CTERM sorting domain-containing protein [Saprospirales bacterium]|nr:IPTL-CTERM sorting domain-containing protein [Saprospirales bacterium]
MATTICDCPTGYIAVGYQGLEGNMYGAMVLSQFSLRCKQLNPDGTLGNTIVVTCSDGTASGNTPDGPIDAAAGQVLVGAQPRIGCAIDALIGRSKLLSDVILGLPNTTSNTMQYIGGAGGSLGPLQHVPNGNVIVGMQSYENPDNNIAAGVAWRYAPIQSCPVMACGINTISVSNISACNNGGTSNPLDDTFTANVTVSFSNPPATGTLNLSGDGTASIAVGSLGAGTHTFTGVTMSADGSLISLTAGFSADPTCTLTNPEAGMAPAACSVAGTECIISAITLSNISGCNDNGTPANAADDIFTADVTVTFFDPPTSGNLNLLGDGSASVPVGSLGPGTYTFSAVTMVANGGDISLSAIFSAEPTCVFTNHNTGTAPTSCSLQAPTIPTMSEWGLILFALILFTLSVVFGTRQIHAMAMGGSGGKVSGSTSSWKLPFDRTSYFRILPIVYLGIAVVFTLAVVLFGYEMTSADVPGSLLAGPIIAYLVHFVKGSNKG